MQIEAEHLKIVKNILNQHLPGNTKVWVFGSRLKETTKKYADLDLAIDISGKPISFELLASLLEDFEASALPYKVDVVDLNTISTNFRQIIEEHRAPLMFVEE